MRHAETRTVLPNKTLVALNRESIVIITLTNAADNSSLFISSLVIFLVFISLVSRCVGGRWLNGGWRRRR